MKPEVNKADEFIARIAFSFLYKRHYTYFDLFYMIGSWVWAIAGNFPAAIYTLVAGIVISVSFKWWVDTAVRSTKE